MFIFSYVGYRGCLLPFHSSVPSFKPFPHFCQTDQDRSVADLDSSSSKRNNSSSPKQVETELEQIQRNLEIPISDRNRSAFIHLLILYFHHLILHLLKSKTKLYNQHKCFHKNYFYNAKITLNKNFDRNNEMSELISIVVHNIPWDSFLK